MVSLDPIRTCPAFTGLTESELHEIADALERVRARPDEEIISEGQSQVEKQGIFVLAEGKARVVKRGREIAVLSAPSVFGEIEFLTRMAPTASVRAHETPTLYWMSRQRLDDLLGRGSLAAYKLLANLGRVLAQRLRATDDKFVELIAADKKEEFSEFRAKILSEWNF